MTSAARLIMALLLFFAAGCNSNPTAGYSTSPVFPTTIRTIAVPVFANETFDRGLEFELTDALIKEIQSRTPYRIAAQARADSVLSGRIRSIERRQLSKSRLTGLSEEAVVSVTIDFQWKDLRTSRSLVERRSFSGHGLFVPSNPTGEPIELGQFAAVEYLARDIVSEMQADW